MVSRPRRLVMQYGDYLLAAILVMLAGLGWADPTRIIAAGDNFPVYAFNADKYVHEGLQMLSTATAGVGMPDLQFTFLVPGLLAKALALTGLGPVAIEMVILLAVYAVAGYGTIRLLRALKVGLAGRMAGTVLVLSNLFVAQLFPGPVQIFTLGFVGWTGALWLELLRAPGIKAVAAFVIPTVLLSFLFMNPPMVGIWACFLAFMTLGAWWAERIALTPRIRYVAGALLGTLAVNAWWLYGFAVSYLGRGSGGGAFTLGEGWNWVMQRASLANVVSFQASWAWNDPLYYPWYRLYQSRIMQLLLFLPIGVALLYAALRRHLSRWDKLQLAGLAVCIFLAKGSHEPFGALNRWLIDHVPGLWLFRSPYGQFGLIQLLLMACLCARFTDLVMAFLRVRRVARPMALAAATLCMLPLLGSGGYALLTGAVLPDYDHGLPPAYVQAPPYWREAADYLGSHGEPSGRVLVLPADDFYQMNYSWGYYGADVVPYAFLNRDPILVTLASSTYMEPGQGYNALLQGLWQALNAGTPIDAYLRSLGVDYVLLRGDIQGFQDRSVVNPEQMRSALARQTAIAPDQNFGPLQLYKVNHPWPVLEMTVAQQRAGKPTSGGTAPIGQAERLSPTHYRAKVSSAGPVTVVLKTMERPGWQLQIKGGQPVQTFRAEGYANGWILPPGSHEFDLVYTPQRTYSVLLLASGLLLLVLVGVLFRPYREG